MPPSTREKAASSASAASRACSAGKRAAKIAAMPAEIAALAVFLCRREAHNITGAALPVDGGWTAQ